MPKGYLVANIRVTDAENSKHLQEWLRQLSKSMVAKF